VGCDIHGMIERAERGTYSTRDAWCRWRAAGEVDVGRDYELFAALAGVRNYVGLVPICAPKGLPGYGGLEEDSLGGYHRWDAANDEPRRTTSAGMSMRTAPHGSRSPNCAPTTRHKRSMTQT
jgi:hypothetical protein